MEILGDYIQVRDGLKDISHKCIYHSLEMSFNSHQGTWRSW